MTTLKKSIVDKLIASLQEAEELDDAAIEALGQLLAGEAKVKPDDLVTIFERRDEVT